LRPTRNSLVARLGVLSRVIVVVHDREDSSTERDPHVRLNKASMREDPAAQSNLCLDRRHLERGDGDRVAARALQRRIGEHSHRRSHMLA